MTKSKSKSKGCVVDKSDHSDVEMTDELKVSDIPSKITEDMDEAALCEGCYEHSKPCTSNKDDFEIVYCETCLAPAHVSCIGRKIKFELHRRSTDNSEENEEILDKMFKCDKCEDKYKESVKCILCHRSEGLMKRVHSMKNLDEEPIPQSEFVHIICALYNDSFCIVDFDKMIFSRIKVQAYTNEKPCMYCNDTNGFMVKCDRLHCREVAHLYCLCEDKKESIIAETSSSETPSGGWEISYKELCSDKYYEERKDIGIEGSARPIIKDDRNNEWCRGGFITFKCDIHRDEEEYCFCKITEDNQTFMIKCDRCDKWYHGACAGILKYDENNTKEYICEQCNEWDKIIINTIIPCCKEKKKIKEMVTKNEYKPNLIPKYLNCFKLVDYLAGIYK